MEVVTVPSIPFLGITPDGRVMNMISGKWLTVCDNGHGYKNVFICVNNKRYVRYVHRLVAECFIQNPDGLPEVNHKDGNKSNNSVDNLEWCTSADNKHHSQRLGLRNNRTQKQLAAASRNGKKNIQKAREGWFLWSKTDVAKEQWMKNLEKADRWHKKSAPSC